MVTLCVTILLIRDNVQAPLRCPMALAQNHECEVACFSLFDPIYLRNSQKLHNFCSKVSPFSAQPILQHAVSSLSQQASEKASPGQAAFALPFAVINCNVVDMCNNFYIPKLDLFHLNLAFLICSTASSIGGTYSAVHFNICSPF